MSKNREEITYLDSQGNATLVGLTFQETSEFIAMTNIFLKINDFRDRYYLLLKKHEAARADGLLKTSTSTT